MPITTNSVAITEAKKLNLIRSFRLASVSLAADTAINGTDHPERDLLGSSSVARTHTIAATGFTAGDRVFGQNNGAGSMTFVGAGFSITANPALFPSAGITQGEPFAFRCDANAVWVRTS